MKHEVNPYLSDHKTRRFGNTANQALGTDHKAVRRRRLRCKDVGWRSTSDPSRPLQTVCTSFNVGTSLLTAVLDGARQRARVPATDILTSKTLSLSIDEPSLRKHASLSTKANLSKEVPLSEHFARCYQGRRAIIPATSDAALGVLTKPNLTTTTQASLATDEAIGLEIFIRTP